MRSAFTQAGFYPFEGPETIDLSLIPLSIRYKLDRAEIKLHLSQWQKISIDDRQRLLETPCGTATELTTYRALLLELIERYFSESPTFHPLTSDEPWANSLRWPQVVIEQSEKQSTALPPVEQWQTLSEMDRHALFVLGRSKHAHQEFVAAMNLFFKNK